MEGLTKIMDINDVYLTKVINYYNSEYFKSKHFLNHNTNYIIYSKDPNFKKTHSLDSIRQIRYQVRDDLNNFIDNLKKLLDINRIFYLEYIPKGEVSFHIDRGLNRYILPLNDDNKFYNYECLLEEKLHEKSEIYNKLHEKSEIYNKMRKDFPEKIDEFNEFFLNDSELNSVHNLKSGSVYSIGNSLHTFINNSNKVRVNLVFEVNP
jgi:hypothetical protein